MSNNKTSDKEYYIATKDENDEDTIYESGMYALTELDFINLIKIMLIEGRGKMIGKKLLEVYTDSTKHRKQLTRERLTAIGLEADINKTPIKPNNATKK